MNIVILTNEAFPYGAAATNRIISYSKPIVNSGNNVRVVCLRPTEIENEKIINKEVNGVYNCISFDYASGTTHWPKSGEKKIKKFYLTLKGYINAVRILIREKKSGPLDCVLLYSNSFNSILLYYLVSKILGVNFIQEKNEYPLVLKHKSFLGKIYAYLYVNIAYKLCDGMLIETNTLIQYYKTKIGKKTKICRVPMSVETDRFFIKTDDTKKTKYIAYCGNMQIQEGITILIDAFKIIANKFNDVQLYLIGSPDTKLLKDYKKQIKDLALDNRVVFTGKINSDEMPEYLCNATVLALARRKTIQAEGSLPSKLGEYLSTSNPVVITRNGEVTDYLQDGINAFLAVPDSVESFAEKLDFVLSHPIEAKEVGQKGKETALKYFNSKIQANLIIDFIYELNKLKK